ncbi:MAG TPA: polysaccharide biosynthesis protein, partial [Xanthomonadaceae bacterium]|nr:polysaccharide biosynthesis protein [Xanthomonadaceae bacterium]
MTRWKDNLANGVPRLAVGVHDMAMVWLTWVGLHQLRFAVAPSVPPLPLFSPEIGLVLLAQGAVFWHVGLYRGIWRFASVPDLLNILKASVFGLMGIAAALFLYNRLDQVPRSVLVLYPLALTALLGMPRLLYRSWKDFHNARRAKAGLRVLILGAGSAGEALVRDLRRVGTYVPVGFLDDAGKLRGSVLHGLPVLGRIEDVERVAPETAANLLVIAMPSLDAPAMRRIVAACERTSLPFRTVPRLDDLLEGRSLPGDLKEVAIEDLLGRQPVTPDW